MTAFHFTVPAPGRVFRLFDAFQPEHWAKLAEAGWGQRLIHQAIGAQPLSYDAHNYDNPLTFSDPGAGDIVTTGRNLYEKEANTYFLSGLEAALPSWSPETRLSVAGNSRFVVVSALCPGQVQGTLLFVGMLFVGTARNNDNCKYWEQVYMFPEDNKVFRLHRFPQAWRDPEHPYYQSLQYPQTSHPWGRDEYQLYEYMGLSVFSEYSDLLSVAGSCHAKVEVAPQSAAFLFLHFPFKRMGIGMANDATAVLALPLSA